MMPTRRTLLAAAAAGITSSATIAQAGNRAHRSAPGRVAHNALRPSQDADHTEQLQVAIDQAAAAGEALVLGPGVFHVRTLVLHAGTVIIGVPGATVLRFEGGPSLLHADDADRIALRDLTLDGANRVIPATGDAALLKFSRCRDLRLEGLAIQRVLANALLVNQCSGRIADCTIHGALLAAIRSLDAQGLAIVHNDIANCGNAGIQVWRTQPGEDLTLIAANRIARIAAKGGGTGENGNGVNVFRADGVIVSSNHITDCAYSAVRGNTASNLQIIDNTILRVGEVALYAEFAFQGAVISGNVVDGAASGISVTNFNEGGRLAVVEGNVIRNLFRREHEAVDKRGEGISIEADSIVSGNVIEGAPTCGIQIGWGSYLRDCLVTGNLIRETAAGILISNEPGAGTCLVSANLISRTTLGAIRMMDRGRPVGADLALEAPQDGRVSVHGNLVS
jgi:uncharacterized secreted repeat protein (TIGR03808 family)